MATLRNVNTGTVIRLRERCLVGRSPVADLRLCARGSSNEHATILWDGAQWTLRDLTSRNGTRINGTLLLGQQWRLTRGDTIVFGDPTEQWQWVDSAPPSAVAVRADGTFVEAENGLLLLPNELLPRASVSVRDGQWELEIDAVIRPVANREVIVLEQEVFTLQLPAPDPTSQLTHTIDQSASTSTLIRFRANASEEHVDVTIEANGKQQMLPARTFNYMLLLLARARESDRNAGVADQDAGWMYTLDLARKLNTTAEVVNVDVHRARRTAVQTGIANLAESLIERRRSTGELRLGIRNIAL